jgi:hypothetical protein
MLLIKENKNIYIIWLYIIFELYNGTKPNPYSLGLRMEEIGILPTLLQSRAHSP